MLNKSFFKLATFAVIGLFVVVNIVQAEDWNRFRGPNGSGVHANASSLPSEFSETKNLAWKFKMPGPGSSCPIVVGDKVFVTCWTGYGTDGADSGKQEDLKRHLICVDLNSGEKKWDVSVDAALPEDDYSGMMLQHGYASHTPVSDGKHVYAFFGKSGVHAYDMDGKKVWEQSVGDNLDRRRWGSSCSPILHQDLVIVLASAESTALLALNKKDGKKVWEQDYQAFDGNWSTPLIAKVDDKKSDLVVSTAEEIWGLNPATGNLRWYVASKGGAGGAGGRSRGPTISSSFGYDGTTVVHVGSRGAKSTAFKPGGSDDIAKTHVVWESPTIGSHASPIIHDGLVYSIAGRTVTVLDAKTGEKVYQKKLPTVARSAGGGNEGSQGGGQGGSQGGGRGGDQGGGRGGRGGRGGFGSQDYSSPVLADGKIYYVSRKGAIHVLQAGREYKELATNRFESDNGDFSATPAIADKHVLIRSSNYLYCVGNK